MKIIVAITGASGAIYGIRLLEALRNGGAETHLIISAWGEKTIELETDYTLSQVRALADAVYQQTDLAAAVSSGSFLIDAMVVAPCSMKTLSAIRHGYSSELIARAADVTLKEGRSLILVPRETPLNQIHLENMLSLSRMGVTMLPPVPAFYTHPATVDDIVDQTVYRILDRLGIPQADAPRWK